MYLQLQEENQVLNQQQSEQLAQLQQLAASEQQLREQLERQDLLLQQARLRLEVTVEKQQLEADQARETIRVLRQELAKGQEDHQAALSDLQSRLTEYKLKFEYAQRQLSTMP